MQLYKEIFNGQSEQLQAIRNFVGSVVRQLGVSEEDAFACQLVVDEAATNAFLHGYSGQPGKVEVEIARKDSELFLYVRNWGAPFDPDAVPVPDVSKSLAERSPGGLGLFLMRQFTDSIAFSFDPVQGNEIAMTRQIQAPDR